MEPRPIINNDPRRFLIQHKDLLKGLKKQLPSSVTFLSVYRSAKYGYCAKAVINKKDCFFSIGEDSYMTPSDIQRLEELIIQRHEGSN